MKKVLLTLFINQVFPTLSYEVGRLFTSVNVAIRNITRKDYENNR